MLESVPIPLQTVLWPLLGTAVIVALRRFLPNWLRRVVALAAALASLSALWSLRAGPADPVTIFWEPLTFFRTSPGLSPTGPALFAGVILAGTTAALVLGIRGTEPQTTVWHGLVLAALAGCLITVMGANLLTLVLGSGLLDLALVAMALSGGDGPARVTWRMVVPGVASTLLLLASAVQMDAEIGTTSLAARNFPADILILMGAAGLMRLLIFPLHPRGLNHPEGGATLLLPMGLGIYLLARAQAIGPVLADQPWMLALGGTALVAGGVMAWASSVGSGGMAGSWSGIAVHQAGLALAYVLLLGATVPWPWLGLALALGVLAVWWDSVDEGETAARPEWLAQLAARLQPVRERVMAAVATPTARLRRWRDSALVRHAVAILPSLALISLAGIPLSVGALARWPLYAILLRDGPAGLLVVAFVADTFLTAGLWAMLGQVWRTAGSHKFRPGAILAMLALTLFLFRIGMAPSRLTDVLGLAPVQVSGVSMWGLGLILVLPWLLGAWLARLRDRLGRPLEWAQRFVRLEWLYGAVGEVGRRLVDAVYWLGMVGEGEGWWGWALIILALGAVFLTIR
jgi:NADH:ubiquinone oxidoreductase subunit 2 (subunit N)